MALSLFVNAASAPNVAAKSARQEAKAEDAVHGGHGRWTIIVGALMVQIILGTIYAFSVFVGPLEAEFGWNRLTTQWAYSVALVMFAVVMIPAGRLQDQIGPRKVAMIGGALLGLSFILASVLVTGDRPWAFYLTYGIIGGAGIGFGYVCPISAAVKWFPDKKGLITGIAVAGFGAGTLFFAGPASALMLPPVASGDSLSLYQVLLIGLGVMEGQGSGIGWRAFFALHGIVCATVVILGAMLLRNPPPGWKPAGWNPSQVKHKVIAELEWRDMLNTPLATMLWMTFIFGATSGLMAIGQWTPMMRDILGDASLAPDWMGTFARFLEPVAILAIFNALGRIFWGKVCDIIGSPRSMMLMFLLQGMMFMILASIKAPLGIVAASAWVGLNFGGIFTLFPTATSDYFGLKNFGVNYGWIYSGYGVAGIMGPIVGGVLYDMTGSYLLAFIFAGTLCFVAAGSAVVVWGLARAEEQARSRPPV